MDKKRDKDLGLVYRPGEKDKQLRRSIIQESRVSLITKLRSELETFKSFGLMDFINYKLDIENDYDGSRARAIAKALLDEVPAALSKLRSSSTSW